MPIGAIIGAVAGLGSQITGVVAQRRERRDRDDRIEDELRYTEQMQILDPNLYNVCVDQYDQTGSISNVCKNAGFSISRIEQQRIIKDDQTRKIVIGIVLAIILFVAVYFLIIKK
tara:strand:- start:235 stop:579 length:345 start_codon:yes stop_codon:yes gene_type:complete